jgi:Leucine-rich repeat (LRR) protein
MYNQKVSLSREIWDSDGRFDDNVFWEVTLLSDVNNLQNLTSLDIMHNHLNPG